MNLYVGTCLMFGLLWFVMTCFAIYLINIYGKLEKQLSSKCTLLEKSELELKKQKVLVQEQEIYATQLREEIGARDRKIGRMERKGYVYE